MADAFSCDKTVLTFIGVRCVTSATVSLAPPPPSIIVVDVLLRGLGLVTSGRTRFDPAGAFSASKKSDYTGRQISTTVPKRIGGNYERSRCGATSSSRPSAPAQVPDRRSWTEFA